MAMAAGWAYYYRIRPQADDMKDKLGLYLQYKEFWKKHTLPGERRLLNLNEYASCCASSSSADIRLTSDHMDTLRLYNGYKHYWDKHRIPGEMIRNEQLWEDPWWKQKKLMNLQTRSTTRSLPPLRSRKLKRKGAPASAASANSSSTIRTSKSLPAKMAARTPPEIETKQNGTQTDRRLLSATTLPKSLTAPNVESSSLPLITPTTPNNSEKLSDTASVSSLTDTKLPPVVNKEVTAA